MKNIYLLPTDKDSNLFIGDLSNQLHFNYSIEKGNSINQNVYITSDEPIKEGDWLITLTNDVIQWAKILRPNGKKIILTTDQDLIKDGVQAIDDEFLEWFVINPSCKFVEIHTYSKKIGTETDKNGYREMNVFGNHYKIIIPQEEPKQETLEEAADIMSTDVKKVHPADSYIFKQGFLEGAKSDAARDYWFKQFKKKQ